MTTPKIIAAVLLLGQIALAADFTIDKDHSTIGFSVKHLMSNVKGNFNDFSGKIVMDEKAPSKDKVKLVVNTESIDTRNTKRNDHLKSPDFFDVKKFPEMTFDSTKVTKKGKNKFLVEGNLKMHGVEKLVKLDVEYLGTATDPWGGTRASFTAKGELNRKDYGLTWNKALEAGGFLVGDDIKMEFEVEATADKAPADKPASSPAPK